MEHPFYEQYRENTEIHVSRNGSHQYPAHFHINPEIFMVRRGRYRVNVNGTLYEMNDGFVALFSSYDIHDYAERLSSDDAEIDDCVIIIPPKYLDRFFSNLGNLRPATPVIHSPRLCDQLIELSDRVFSKENFSETIKQAAVELFFALIESEFKFVPAERNNENILIRALLSYILAHYRENITLESISKALGYTPAHLSRIFHQYFRIWIPQYINNLRLDYLEMRQNGTKKTKITDLLFEAGFGSIQTYYRCKAARKKGNFTGT